MYRVVIADDEPMILKGLREAVEWDSFGLEIAGEAKNGLEALAFVKSYKPHILLTDIKMPDMDGIELIREIRKSGIEIKIIILSAYSDYAYLKDAIKLGVDNYLLKPLDYDDLVSNLTDLVSTIEKEHNLYTQRHQGADLLQVHILNRLVTGNISLQEFREKASFLSLDIEAEQYVCTVCCADNSAFEIFKGDEQLALYALHNICAEIAGDAGIAFVGANGRIVFLFRGSQDVNLREVAHGVMQDAKKQIQKCLGFSVIFGAGMVVQRLDEVSMSYDSAQSCLTYATFLISGGVIWHNQIEGCDYQDERSIDISYERITNLIMLGKREEFFSYVDEIFGEFPAQSPYPLDYVRNFTIQLMIRTMDVFMEQQLVSRSSVWGIDMQYDELMSFVKLDAFHNWYCNICGQLFDNAKTDRKMINHVVKNIIAYIKEHYFERLTLKQVSMMFYMNTSYLGQVFKKETGESFTEYVNNYRIQKAKELLCTSNLRAYEIADRVGYTDYQYFLRIFKKITGANPTELRNI